MNFITCPAEKLCNEQLKYPDFVHGNTTTSTMETFLQRSLIVDSIRSLDHLQAKQVLAYIQSLPASQAYQNENEISSKRMEAMKQIRMALNEVERRTFGF